jgi:hypothetical protein
MTARYVICYGPDRYDENFYLCRNGKFSMGFWTANYKWKAGTAIYRRKGFADRMLKKIQRFGGCQKSFIKELLQVMILSSLMMEIPSIVSKKNFL